MNKSDLFSNLARPNISDKILQGNAAVNEYGKTDSRIYMASGNISHAVCHTDNNKTERKRGGKIAAPVITTGQHRRSTA